MDFFDASTLLNLKNLIAPEDPDAEPVISNHKQGSVLNPSDIYSNDTKKEIAQPYAKINAVLGNKPTTGSTQNAPSKKKNEIWEEEEIKEIPFSKNDTRPRPEFEVLFKQKVGPEDVFLGMSDLDPSSNKCQELLMKIKLPQTKFAEITLDVTQTVVCIQSPKFYLYHALPYQVKEKEGKAKWLSDKEILTISLPIIRDDDF